MNKELTLCEMLANYLKELNAMSNEQLTKEIYDEMGIEVDDLEDERCEYIDELVSANKMAWASRISV